MSLLEKLRALGEENWTAGLDLHPMEREAFRVFRGREGRDPNMGELEAEVARLYPPHFQKPPPLLTSCPHCGAAWRETPRDFGDDDIPF